MINLKHFFVEFRLKSLYKSKSKNQASVYKQTLMNTKKVLIMFPLDESKQSDADNVLRMIFNYFENSKFTIIKPTELNSKMLSIFGLPKKLYFSEFQTDFPFDVIIDLNLKFNKLATFIIGKMDSKLNIRLFKHDGSDSIYHLSICTEKTDLTGKIVTLKAYLDRIKSTQVLV